MNDLEQYIEETTRLIELDHIGAEVEADAMRDAMDATWRRLSQADKDYLNANLLRRVSGDGA